MIDRNEGRRRIPIRHENPAESRLRLLSLERQGIYSFAGAGNDYDVFKPQFPGPNTIFFKPLLYATPSIDLALFFALVKNNPVVSADPAMKTITCEHRASWRHPLRNIYVGADKETLEAVNVPDNSGWVAVFLPGQLQAIQRYTTLGRAGELATHEDITPFELIKVTNRHFPFPLGEIPLYSPPPEWTSEQKRKHSPYQTEGFPCFNNWAKPFAQVYPPPTYML